MSTKIGSRADLDTNVRTFVICWPILTVRVRPTWSLWSLLSCCTYARVLQTPGILKIYPSTLTITHIHCQGSTSVTSFTVAEKPQIFRHQLDRRRSLCERNQRHRLTEASAGHTAMANPLPRNFRRYDNNGCGWWHGYCWVDLQRNTIWLMRVIRRLLYNENLNIFCPIYSEKCTSSLSACAMRGNHTQKAGARSRANLRTGLNPLFSLKNSRALRWRGCQERRAPGFPFEYCRAGGVSTHAIEPTKDYCHSELELAKSEYDSRSDEATSLQWFSFKELQEKHNAKREGK